MTEAGGTAGAAPAPGKGDGSPARMSIMRRAMARRMTEAWAVPVFYLRVTADVTGLVERRAALREAAPAERAPTINDALVRACALALREHPEVNASFDDGSLTLHPRVNVGVAVAVEGGLVVPAVYDADAKDAAGIGAAVRELAELAGRRRLGREVLEDATFTVSNLGMFGIEDFDPIINPPQAAILGVGSVAADDEGRHRMRLTLGCDHRVLTGAEGARFLTTVTGLLGRADDLLPALPATTEGTVA